MHVAVPTDMLKNIQVLKPWLLDVSLCSWILSPCCAIPLNTGVALGNCDMYAVRAHSGDAAGRDGDGRSTPRTRT